MTQDVIDRQPLRLNIDEDQVELIAWFMENLPPTLTADHCAAARTVLGWSVETLASRSGASPDAIRRLENGAELRRVTLQALAFALEAEGLIFFPGHEPMRGENCRGATRCPKSSDDFHLIE